MADEWPAQKFRQGMIAKINHALQSTGQDPNKNAGVMESHIFKKSRNKEEYMGLVAKLFMHFQDIAQRKPTQPPPPPNTEMNQQGMMPDPLNALQTLASQGNRNTQMAGGPNPNQMGGPGGPVAASSLLQTLNQQRPGQQMQQMQGIRGQMPMGAGPSGQMMPQMGGNIGAGMQMGVMGGTAGGAVSGAGGPQPQMVGNAPQMTGMQGQMSQMAGGGPGGPSSGTVPGGPAGAPNQMQIGSGQMQGGPMNTMNVQQMPQMQQMGQNQMPMGMNQQQINQMMNARLNAGGMGPNAGPQGMQGIPPNMQQGQSGQIHSSNVSGPQGQQSGPPNPGQPGGMNTMMSMGPNIQQKGNMPMGQGGQMFPVNRGVPGQQQFLRQSPSPSTVPSPAGMAATQQQQQQGGPNQQQQPQLPNPQMISSPAMAPSSSPQMSNIMQNAPRNMRQSPSTLNTPGQVTGNSPFNPQEDHLYREKYKQLTKYIDPLKRMMAKIGTDGANTEKFTKMSKLLEILSNPAQRVPLETLLKCEKALEKMDIVNFPSQQQFAKSANPLLEALHATLQSPLANHTLHRTFRPCLDILFGSDICAPRPPKIQHIEVENTKQTEEVVDRSVQREFSGLAEKYKVTMDCSMYNNSKSTYLICRLDDTKLPVVPPLYVNVPEGYPCVPPACTFAESEYLTTPFLRTVLKALNQRIAYLPKCYTLTQLLDSWEMAVRQACSPSAKSEHV